MSEFTDFMTMKLIEERRMQSRGFSNKELEVSILEQVKAVKNLNVRVPINMIGLVEVLANRLFVSKAELVLEMLQSSINEALEMIEKEGKLEGFMEDFYAHMEKHYQVALTRDENGKIISFSIPNQNQQNQNEDD